MTTRRILAAALAATIAAALLLSFSDAGAIPAFARKYQISCTTCHAPFPRLKAYGEEFAGRGFRMEAGQEPVRATYDVGDPLLLLPRDLPLAARMEGYLSWKEDSDAETDIEWPWVWKILSGGPIGRTASYYFYFLMERGEVVGLEDAYLQLNDVLGSGFDLVFGQFQVCDPLFKRELRLERFDYLIFKTRVGDSPVDLTYDRGLMLVRTLPGDVDLVAMALNGNGIGAAEDAGISDFKNHDNDQLRNFALRLAKQAGPVRLGGFGYFGRTEDKSGPDKVRNETWYAGPDLVVDLGDRAQLNAQFLYREDDDPFFTGTEDCVATRGGFAELHWFPRGHDGRWAFSALYNKVTSSDENVYAPAKADLLYSQAERETISLTANHLIARNLRLTLEGGRDIEMEKTRLTIGLISAF